jgi:hypothetical protein
MNQGLVQNGHMSAATQALISNYSEPRIIKRQITCLDQIHGLFPIISLALLNYYFYWSKVEAYRLLRVNGQKC